MEKHNQTTNQASPETCPDCGGREMTEDEIIKYALSDAWVYQREEALKHPPGSYERNLAWRLYETYVDYSKRRFADSWAETRREMAREEEELWAKEEQI